jgi:pentatricopeptide repeat domain-containing protein 1
MLTGYSGDMLLGMERNVMLWLGHDLSAISPMRVAQVRPAKASLAS